MSPGDLPWMIMNFRNEPLPSYEDIISGNFRKSIGPSGNKEKENKSSIKLDSNDTVTSCIAVHLRESESGTFKYVNKIINEPAAAENEAEEGELLSENEADIKVKPKPKNNNMKQNNSSMNQKKNTTNTKVQKPVQKHAVQNNQRKARDFTSNITTSQTTPSLATNINTFVPRLVCRYFMEGLCSKAEKCTFSHAVIPNKTPAEARVKEVCKFFIMGSCMKGEACYFSHDLSVVPCKFFHLRGECATVSKGGQCRFSHAPIDTEALEKLRQAESERIKEKAAEDQEKLLLLNNIKSIEDSNTKDENSQTCKETETTTNRPHEFGAVELLLNPFAGDDDEYY